MPDARTLFAVNDRVIENDRAIAGLRRRRPPRTGTVRGFSASHRAVRVVFDGRVTAESLHVTFLDKVPDEDPGAPCA